MKNKKNRKGFFRLMLSCILAAVAMVICTFTAFAQEDEAISATVVDKDGTVILTVTSETIDAADMEAVEVQEDEKKDTRTAFISSDLIMSLTTEVMENGIREVAENINDALEETDVNWPRAFIVKEIRALLEEKGGDESPDSSSEEPETMSAEDTAEPIIDAGVWVVIDEVEREEPLYPEREDFVCLTKLDTPQYVETRRGVITGDDTVFIFYEGVYIHEHVLYDRYLYRRYHRGVYSETFIEYGSLKDGSMVSGGTINEILINNFR